MIRYKIVVVGLYHNDDEESLIRFTHQWMNDFVCLVESVTVTKVSPETTRAEDDPEVGRWEGEGGLTNHDDYDFEGFD